jgi:dUTP pyrophosphatase
MLSIPIINRSDNPLPQYATPLSAGMDIHAHLEAPIELAPFERVLVPTGLYIELPAGYEAQLRMRSGLALKKGLILPNAPATIDADYRGEIKVIIANISNQVQSIAQGERIAQLIIAKHETVQWALSTQLSDTQRGEGGFGSTGK